MQLLFHWPITVCYFSVWYSCKVGLNIIFVFNIPVGLVCCFVTVRILAKYSKFPNCLLKTVNLCVLSFEYFEFLLRIDYNETSNLYLQKLISYVSLSYSFTAAFPQSPKESVAYTNSLQETNKGNFWTALQIFEIILEYASDGNTQVMKYLWMAENNIVNERPFSNILYLWFSYTV